MLAILHTFLDGFVLDTIEILVGLISCLCDDRFKLTHDLDNLGLVDHFMTKTFFVVMEDIGGRIDFHFSIRVC